jgi:hypothetical protein
MTDLELIFSMLGEAATTEITRVDDVRASGKVKKPPGRAERWRGRPVRTWNGRPVRRSFLR